MTGLKITLKCIIGALEIERKKAQNVKIKIAYEASEFLDYTPIIKLVNKEMKKQKFAFLEQACEFLADNIKKTQPSIKKLKIKISKPELYKIYNLGSKTKPFAKLSKKY